MTFRAEFPDFPAADFPALPPTFTDTSWHNDACPSMTSDVYGLTIWIDYADPDQREHPDTKRFTVGHQEAGVEIGCESFDSDDWTEVLTYILKKAMKEANT